MKCPRCGREITSDRVLVPVYGEDGKPMDFFCADKDAFNKFKQRMEENNLTFEDFMKWAVEQLEVLEDKS